MSSSLSLVDSLLTKVTGPRPPKAVATEKKSAASERRVYDDCYGGGVAPLKAVDPEIYALIRAEEDRQRFGLELIASENFTSRAVMEAVGSCLTNKYSEGLPGKRYYGGNEVIDKLEDLCRSRALALFDLDPKEWGVNVQPYSGSTANFAAMNAVLQPSDRLMGLGLADGGHLSHGYYRGHRPVNASAKYWASLPYHIHADTGLIDYDDMRRTAVRFAPKLLIAGSSAYARDWDYGRMRSIADEVGDCLLLVDMAHYSGLVATAIMHNPFDLADIVTTTTHKSLRGTRAAMIFFRKALEKAVNSSVFPGIQGGPHNHAIAGVAVALREALSPQYSAYAKAVVGNCQALAAKLKQLGHKIVTDGTDCHLLLMDLRPEATTGSKLQHLCDLVNMTLNKNTVAGDRNAVSPGGVRIGTPALTSRGLDEGHFVAVAHFLHEAVLLTKAVAKKAPSKKMKDFKETCKGFDGIEALRQKVVEFASQFPMPGRSIEGIY